MNKIIAFCFYVDMFILGKQTTIFKNNVYDWQSKYDLLEFFLYIQNTMHVCITRRYIVHIYNISFYEMKCIYE